MGGGGCIMECMRKKAESRFNVLEDVVLVPNVGVSNMSGDYMGNIKIKPRRVKAGFVESFCFCETD